MNWPVWTHRIGPCWCGGTHDYITEDSDIHTTLGPLETEPSLSVNKVNPGVIPDAYVVMRFACGCDAIEDVFVAAPIGTAVKKTLLVRSFKDGHEHLMTAQVGPQT